MEKEDIIIKKLDEILEYLHSRKPEVDEKLEMAVKCMCGPFEEEDFECDCEECDCDDDEECEECAHVHDKGCERGCECDCCKDGKCDCKPGKDGKCTCDCECCKAGKCKCGKK